MYGLLHDGLFFCFVVPADSIEDSKNLQSTSGSINHILETLFQGIAVVIIEEIPASVCSIDDDVQGLGFVKKTNHPPCHIVQDVCFVVISKFVVLS
jgi:hypothetical protein